MRKLLHRFELRIAILAALALLLAQLGAMSHAYSHDAAVGSAARHQSAAIHDVCSDCVAHAPLLAPAGGLGALPSIESQGHGPATRATPGSLLDLSLNLAFRSRAPPSTR